MIELNSYYHDRGIVKYQGMFLAEHTERIKKEFEATMTMSYDELSTIEISSVIEEAFTKNIPVSIQTNTINLNNRQHDDALIGFISGFDTTHLYINTTAIPYHSIWHIQLFDLLDFRTKIDN